MRPHELLAVLAVTIPTTVFMVHAVYYGDFHLIGSFVLGVAIGVVTRWVGK